MRTVPYLMACLLASWLPSAAAAESANMAQMQVSARVLSHVRLEPVGPVATSVTVTPADLEQGYVDVAHRYTVRTNAPERVRLRFQPQATCARSITIEGFGGAVPLRDEPVELSPRPGRELAFTVRLWLPAGVAPGECPWPVQVVAVVD